MRGDLRSRPLTHEFAVTDIGRYPSAYRHFYRRPNGAEEHILLVCNAGSGFCRTPTKSFVLTPHQFAIIPAGGPHEYGADDHDPWTILWCHFTGNYGNILAQYLPLNRAPYGIAPVASTETNALFDLAFDVMKRGFSMEHLTVASALIRAALTVLVFDNPALIDGEDRHGNRHVESAVEFINRNLDKSITVQNVADAVGLSASRLTQLFHSYVGQSPKRYVRRERVLRACHFLDATDAPISQIAELVGYPDPLHFSRVFRQVLGRSPRQYRARPLTSSEERR
jgi:AraC family transcriptional regulator, arabinose operon regulatory protein